jgi:putrescine aminotransferase
MLAGVELVTSKTLKTKPDPALGLSEHLSQAGYRNGLIFRAFADGIVGFAPPLSCTEDEIELIVGRFRKTLDDVLNIKEIRDAVG